MEHVLTIANLKLKPSLRMPHPNEYCTQCGKHSRTRQCEVRICVFISMPSTEDSQIKTRFKVFWSSRNGSFVFNQIFDYGTLMGVDYKSEKKI